MSFLNTLSFGIKSVFYKSKILYPSILNLIPPALFSVLFAMTLPKISDFLQIHQLEDIIYNRQTVLELLGSLKMNIITFVIISIISFVLYVYLISVYTEIGKRIYKNKKIDLVDIMTFSYQKFYSLIYTYLLIIASLLTLVAVFFLLSTPFNVIGTILFLAISIILVFIALTVFWLIPVVVALENRTGIDSIRRSLVILKESLFRVYLLIIAMLGLIGLINTILLYIPFIGFYIAFVSKLFYLSWTILTPVHFYYENLKLRKISEEDYL